MSITKVNFYLYLRKLLVFLKNYFLGKIEKCHLKSNYHPEPIF